MRHKLFKWTQVPKGRKGGDNIPYFQWICRKFERIARAGKRPGR